MVSDTTLAAAFIGGVISFLSPCVLPILPGFLSYLAGVSVLDSENHRRDTFLASLFFVLGFSFVFSILGVLLNTLTASLGDVIQLWLSRLGGIIIILFGLFLMKLIRIPYLEREHRIAVHSGSRSKYATSFLFGAAFAAGWSPCVGAVLGAILTIAASNPGSGSVLLFTYSLGLGLPFLLVGFFASRASSVIERIVPYLQYVSIAFGAILVALGVLAFTQSLNLLANFDILNQYLISE